MNTSEIAFSLQAPRVFFGVGVLKQLPNLCREICGIPAGTLKILLCMGSSFPRSSHYDKLREMCCEAGVECVEYTKPGGEPTVDMVEEGTQMAKETSVNCVIAVGGGSVMDTGKAIAGMVNNSGNVADYQDGRPFPNPMLPFIAIPTTAGTGAEVSNNAVLIDPRKGIKASVRGGNLRPTVALVDPELTLGIPPIVTAYSGMDALVQAIEAYVSRAANYLSDIFAERAIMLLGGNLLHAFNEGDNLEARSAVALGSLLSGLAFSNAKLGAVHGFAHPIGVQHEVAHGLICGLLLPHVMEYNLETVTEKYARVADLFVDGGFLSQSMLGNPKKMTAEEKANWAIRAVKELLVGLQMPSHLTDIGIQESDLPAIVADTKGGSLANNPRDTSPETLREILDNAL